jgi:effector-binding domain-containing protein
MSASQRAISMTYLVSVQHVEPRAFAAVRGTMPLRDVPSRFRELLDPVYAAARSGAISLDGQNIFVYRANQPGIADVEFGVGARNEFAPVGRVTYSSVPGGEVATTTHWGNYAKLGAAHDAVVAWCVAGGRKLTGVSWEVYGHWNDDPAKLRTDVYHLLQPAG